MSIYSLEHQLRRLEALADDLISEAERALDNCHEIEHPRERKDVGEVGEPPRWVPILFFIPGGGTFGGFD